MIFLKEEYIKIKTEDFDDLMRLLKEIISELPSMPHHRRSSLYATVDGIAASVYSTKEDDDI